MLSEDGEETRILLWFRITCQKVKIVSEIHLQMNKNQCGILEIGNSALPHTSIF